MTLNLPAEIRDETRVSCILISHDPAIVSQVTDEAIVLHRGTVVERGATARVLDDPQHPYPQRLRASVPRPGWKPGAGPYPVRGRSFTLHDRLVLPASGGTG